MAATNGTESAGMPQLDPAHFTSQIFWLLVSFCLMYFLMHRYALPFIRSILHNRDMTIQGYLEKATKLRSEAEDIKITYDKALRDADEKAEARLNKTLEKIQADSKIQLADLNADIQNRIKQQMTVLETHAKQIEDTIDTAAKSLSQEIVKTVLQSTNSNTKKQKKAKRA